MSSNIEQYNARRRAGFGPRTQLQRESSTPQASPPIMSKSTTTGTAKLDSKDHPKIKSVLAKYQRLLADEHSYIVVHALRAARHVVNQKRSADAFVDEVSPFKDMIGIGIPVPVSMGPIVREKELSIGRFTMRPIVKQGSLGQELKFQVKANIAPSPAAEGKPPLPKYHAYLTLRNNILAEDDEVMRYFPYFGEDAAENDDLAALNLEEAFVDKTKNAQEENMRAEKGIVFVDYVDRFLSEFDLDTNAVSSYLIGDLSKTGWSQSRKDIREKYFPEDFDTSEANIEQAIQKLKPVSNTALEKAETVCAVFNEVMEFSLWEVVQRANEAVRESMAPARTSGGNQGSASKMAGGKTAADAVAQLTGGNPQPYSLESYAALNCLYCYMHECPFHDQAPAKDPSSSYKHGSVFSLAASTQFRKRTMTLGPMFNPLGAQMNNNKDSVFLSGNGAKSPSTTAGSRKHAFAEGAECSTGCFIQATEEERAKRTVWTKAQTQLLQASAVVLRDNPRASCLMASIINKFCYEIEAELQRRSLLSVPVELSVTESMADIEPLDTNQRVPLKRKRPNVKTNGDYPSDCHKTPNANERSYFKPCLHTGPCTFECPCVKEKVMCEKTCMCDADCPRKWKGCKCAASGKACSNATSCPCVRWNRECDPDLCSQCGAAETLSPSNRYDEELAKECCQNVALQRDVPRRTILGVSGVSGLGLFIGESIKKETFLGEYKGEIISNDEAERRGKLYDKRGVSFLFTLNKTQVIDATRAGNKFRFVNHYKKPNCFAKVLFANCTHRIGMFAKRDLVAGEELYFDYGYNNKSVQFIAQEPDFVYQPPAPAEKANKKNRVTNKGNWDTGHTARTSMKKLLKESGAHSSSSNILTTTLPIGSRGRARSTARGSFNIGETRSNTRANTPSYTDAASDTPAGDDDRSRLGSRRSRRRSEDEDSDDEPLVRGRELLMTWRHREQSPTKWEIEASNDEDEDENDDEEEEEDEGEEDHSDVRPQTTNVPVRDDDDDDEEDYAPGRRVRRRMGRERERERGRERAASTSTVKRRKLA